jgi:helix-turn-helix protein
MAIEVIARILPRPVEDFDEMVAPIEKRHPGSGRNLKWTLIGLANHADATTGYCYPGVKRIVRYTGLTKRSVQRALKQAEVIGLLKRRQRVDMTSEYLLNFAMLPYVVEERVFGKENKEGGIVDFDDEPDMFEIVKPADVDISGMLGRHGGTRASDDTDPCHPGTPPVPVTTPPHATLAPNTSVETSVETSEEKSTETVRADISLPLRQYIVDEWAILKASVGDTIAGLRSVTDSMLVLAKTQARLHAKEGETDQEVWRIVFDEIPKSRFLTGRAPPGFGRSTSFRLSFSRLVKPHIFREVVNGAYDRNRADDGNFDPATGEVLGPARKAAAGTASRIKLARQSGAG